VVRRIEFDHGLAKVARARGIRIEEGVKVNGFEVDARGVLVDTSSGPFRARMVVGADGVSGVARKYVTTETATWRAQVLEVDTVGVAIDRPRDIIHFDLSDATLDGYAWDFPTILDGQELMCRGVYHLLKPGESSGSVDLEERLQHRLRPLGLDLAKCKKKRFAERGFAPHEPLAKPRVLLVGEAAGIDPITGEGIAQALLYGRAAAPYVIASLSSNRFDFADWPAHFARTDVGIDLRVRHELCQKVFGPKRDFYDAWTARTPEACELAAAYFGGRPVSKLGLARISASAGLALALRPLTWKPAQRVSAGAPQTAE
jgi:flavin-dependent dehydrogenase